MQHLIENTWYAIARGATLGRRPCTVERLGRRYVMWRTPGAVHAAAAQCPHRGADLGQGRVRGDCLACPYHGIEFGADGTARRRPAEGDESRIPARSDLAMVPAVEAHGFVWIWPGADAPTDAPEWFEDDPPAVVTGAEVVWNVHYSRFMESALDFHHVPFVHRVYAPGIGRRLTDVVLDDQGTRFSMTAALSDPDRGRRVEVRGDIVMPCALRVQVGSSSFAAVGTPVDEHRTWVAALYHPTYTRSVPGLRRIEAWLAMILDFRLFQRQDRAIYERLEPRPSDLRRMALMPADRGVALWIRRWNEMLVAERDAAGGRPVGQAFINRARFAPSGSSASGSSSSATVGPCSATSGASASMSKS